jgi:hypothetical protein
LEIYNSDIIPDESSSEKIVEEYCSVGPPCLKSEMNISEGYTRLNIMDESSFGSSKCKKGIVADPIVYRSIVVVDSTGFETTGSSPELATQKSNITPNDPSIMYLSYISLIPDYENRSLMNLLQTNEMSFSPAHISTLIDYEEDNDEIEDMPSYIFDTLAIQPSLLTTNVSDNLKVLI